MGKERSLAEAEVGKTYEIISVKGRDFIRRRILDLGLTAGSRVKVVAAAPLGDPIDIEIRGFNLSIRRSEASAVKVRMVEGEN
jgi:ferrous iron transport protein A